MQYKVLPLLATMLAMVNAVKLYVCTSKDFTGECTNFDTPRGQCSALPYNDAISSIQMNGLSCDFFTRVPPTWLLLGQANS
ncbi:hypothetical protein ACJZ2D_004396 [Fusarium nematophilum]